MKSNPKKIPYQELNWFKLDNAALIYPSVSTNKWNAVYRISAVLKEPVQPEVLNQALHEIMPRFPHFNVSLNRGIFWFYFQELSTFPNVRKDDDYPCRKIEFKRNKHLFRVLYYQNKVSFEAFHSVSDGYGALVFVNSLLKRYFELLGHSISNHISVLNHLDKPVEEELEDSFARYADLKSQNPRGENRAYRLTGTKDDPGKLNIINGMMDSAQVLEKAKEYHATVTEFLLGILFISMKRYQKSQKKCKYPIRISMSINLRNMFASKSLRNFSSYMNIQLKTDTEDLQTVIENIQEWTRRIDKDYVMGNMNANIKAARNIFLRLTPLVLKNLLLKLVYTLYGERITSTTLTNLGKISTPSEFQEYIERYEIGLGSGRSNSIGVAVITFQNKMVATFSCNIKETQVQRDFYRMLTEMGIAVQIDSNM